MTVASEAEEAWCPPTFNPSTLGLIWLAWWIVQEDSHSTLRASADRVSRRADAVGMAKLPALGFGDPIAADVTAPGFAENLKFWRHTLIFWYDLSTASQ